MIDINLVNKAILLSQEGKFDEAKSIFNNLLTEEPENDVLLSVIGLFYVNTGDYAKAKVFLEKACSINRTLGTLSALGFAEFEQKNYSEAARTLIQSLEYGENPDIYDKLIMSLFETHELKLAIKYSNVMYEKYPQNPAAVAHYVKALTQKGESLKAEKLCVEYLKTNQNAATLWIHLGFLKELIYGDDKQACECFKIASELGHKEADYNMAVSYQKQGDYNHAEKIYKSLIQTRPDDKGIKTSYGMCLLKQKKFKEGYELFFERNKSSLDKITKNKWAPGKDFEKEIVVISDQGYGDNIQFIRYLPFLKEKTNKVTVAIRKQLKELFSKNYSYVQFIDYEEINPEVQSIRITDLAYALNMDFDNIPFSASYLKAPSADIKSNKPKIGLCWEAGGSGIRTMINRTIHIDLLKPILDLKNIQLYSFQVDDTFCGNEKYPQMINLAQNFKNFEDTAKAINGMDLIITVDTAIAHLAGALGKKTFLLLPKVTDWRWFDDYKTTPWYDSIEIFKQTDSISWAKPIEEILCRLKEYSL